MHWCTKVAHCITAWWRNFSHYCHLLRQYDIWFTCSEHREALTGAPTAHGEHKQEFAVQGEVHSSSLNKLGGFITSQQWMGDLKRFTSVSWFAHPWPNVMRKLMVQHWCRQFTADWQHVHDDECSRRPSIITDDLVELVQECIMENRCFTIMELSSHFLQISCSLLQKLLRSTCCSENCVPGGCQNNWHQNTKQRAWSLHWHFCSSTMMTVIPDRIIQVMKRGLHTLH